EVVQGHHRGHERVRGVVPVELAYGHDAGVAVVRGRAAARGTVHHLRKQRELDRLCVRLVGPAEGALRRPGVAIGRTPGTPPPPLALHAGPDPAGCGTISHT